MKIAIMGKGGSGKSSLSWLLSNYISTSTDKKVIAIDADHNMDLTTNFGFEADEATPTIHRKDSEFRQICGLPSVGMWAGVLDKQSQLPISLDPVDDYTQSLSIPIKPNLNLIIGGLGCQDAIEYQKCSHGHLASLKYWLTYLPQSDTTDVIIDSVAGVDMLNYGLYLPCDIAIVAVENLPNSIKVAKQIQAICTKISLPCYFVLNKNSSLSVAEFETNNRELQSLVKGIIPIDTNIIELNYNELKPQTIQSLKSIYDFVATQPVKKNLIQELKAFEQSKK